MLRGVLALTPDRPIVARDWDCGDAAPCDRNLVLRRLLQHVFVDPGHTGDLIRLHRFEA